MHRYVGYLDGQAVTFRQSIPDGDLDALLYNRELPIGLRLSPIQQMPVKKAEGALLARNQSKSSTTVLLSLKPQDNAFRIDRRHQV